MFLIRSLIGRLIVLALVVIVAAGAGWWFFIREDNEAQKEARSVDAGVIAAASAQAAARSSASPAATGNATAAATAAGSATSAASGSSSIAAKSYRLVDGQSQAWYLAPEKLASLPTSSVAKGTTKGVTGEFHLTTTGIDSARPTTFTVDLKSLTSDQRMRDNRVQSALETTKFPTATFTATRITGVPAEFTATETTMQLTGMLDLHGVKKEVTWEVKAKQEQNILSGLATVKFKYADFGINKPDIGGFVSVEEEVTIQIQLFAAPV